MALYAAVEHQHNPGATWLALAVTHLGHAVLLAVLVYVSLVIGFARLVVRPLQAVRAHLYKVATGRLDVLELQAGSREIDAIVSSVNLMVRRMRLGAGDADPHRTALALRDIAGRLRDAAPDAAEAIACAASALEQLVVPGERNGRGGRGALADAQPAPA